jgi:hypothetical protein
MIIYKEIKAEAKLPPIVHDEGGSDSEGEEEDLTAEESKKLFQTIIKGSNIENFKRMTFTSPSLKLLAKPEK